MIPFISGDPPLRALRVRDTSPHTLSAKFDCRCEVRFADQYPLLPSCFVFLRRALASELLRIQSPQLEDSNVRAIFTFLDLHGIGIDPRDQLRCAGNRDA